MSDNRSTITLRTLTGEPLEDERIRGVVLAAARAIAERNGVELLRLEWSPGSVTATLACPRLAAIGFAAELRRITERWHREHSGETTLWGEVQGDADDDWGLDLERWKEPGG